MNKDKIDGYGAIFRFITPILITVALFILGIIRQDLGELKAHFNNHLNEHKIIEIMLESRLTRIETLIKMQGNLK